MTDDTFLDLALRNPVNRALLQRLADARLPECWLVAGCLFQAVWNEACGRDAGADIRDYDVFYFDGSDLSWEAEDAVVRRVKALVADLGVTVDVKNQARVHLWYRQRFGHAYPQLRAACEGIDRFLVAGTCVGIAPSAATPGNRLCLYAPFGLEDVFAGRLRPNPLNFGPTQAFKEKAASYRARWPRLWIDETPAPLPRGRVDLVPVASTAPTK